MPSVKTRSEKAVENAEMASADLEIPVLEFVSPMPVFPDHRQFVLVRVQAKLERPLSPDPATSPSNSAST